MAGGNDIFSNAISSKGAKGPTTEKKKRKRPSKKVPTTVLESSSTNFMDLVQQLTGSAAELAAANCKDGEKRAKSSSTTATDTPNSCSPYSSPSCHGQYPDDVRHSSDQSFFQQFLRSSTSAMSYTDLDDDSSSHSTNYSTPYPNSSFMPPGLTMASLDDYHHQTETSGYYQTSRGFAGSDSRDGDDDESFFQASTCYDSRALENEISAYPSQWREPNLGHSSSDFWYQQMDQMA